MVLEQLASAVRQGHELGVPFRVTVQRGHRPDQVRPAQSLQVPVTQVSASPSVIQQFIDGNHSECTNGRKRADFGPAKLERLTVEKHMLAFTSAWQVEPFVKDVSGIERITSTRILDAFSGIPKNLVAAIDIARV
jgi:hypothetical protein